MPPHRPYYLTITDEAQAMDYISSHPEWTPKVKANRRFEWRKVHQDSPDKSGVRARHMLIVDETDAMAYISHHETWTPKQKANRRFEWYKRYGKTKTMEMSKVYEEMEQLHMALEDVDAPEPEVEITFRKVIRPRSEPIPLDAFEEEFM